MKKIGLIVTMLCISVLIGCGTEKNNSTNGANRHELDYSQYNYSIYYNLSEMKGIEIYAWTNELGIYECGLMMGTNRNKYITEIANLQDNYPCPLNKMSEILNSYSQDTQDEAQLTIVSNPVKEEDLYHRTLPEYLDDDLTYLSYNLGISNLTHEKYKELDLKTEWRENYLLTIDKRELFNSFDKDHSLLEMDYETLKQYLGNPNKEEEITLETYPTQFGGYKCYYELYKANDLQMTTTGVEITISSSYKVLSVERHVSKAL